MAKEGGGDSTRNTTRRGNQPNRRYEWGEYDALAFLELQFTSGPSLLVCVCAFAIKELTLIWHLKRYIFIYTTLSRAKTMYVAVCYSAREKGV